ncbi:13159_t:CDS:2 [Dentiscutata erythropus]|uniref:13159_t:CDS:1 n=1 Tax=Dentiscutata erythropus TaxID=1348616 RepID=A0A9N9HI21_9GLOM|nr:13159_t:CDS:2 [Dentiscutata erythropus]
MARSRGLEHLDYDGSSKIFLKLYNGIHLHANLGIYVGNLCTTFEYKNPLPINPHIESESSNKEHSLINSDTWIDDYRKRLPTPADVYLKKKKTTHTSIYVKRIDNKELFSPTVSLVTTKSKTYNPDKDNKINKLIKLSIPDRYSTEISCWRKAFNLVVLVIESKDICFEDFLEEIRDLNFTFNYLQEVDLADFKTLLEKIVEIYKQKMKIQ